MNKILKQAGMMALIGCLAIVACKKDDDDSDSGTGTTGTTSSTNGTRVDLLTGGNTKTWRPSEAYVDDSPLPLDECEKDDRYTFNKNGKTYSINITTVKCDPNESNVSGTWNFINNETELEIDGDYGIKIQELTASRLVMVSYDTSISTSPGGTDADTTVSAFKQIWVSP